MPRLLPNRQAQLRELLRPLCSEYVKRYHWQAPRSTLPGPVEHKNLASDLAVNVAHSNMRDITD